MDRRGADCNGGSVSTAFVRSITDTVLVAALTTYAVSPSGATVMSKGFVPLRGIVPATVSVAVSMTETLFEPRFVT
jgi:hypothetical protein